jgi:hypothetical protein
MTTRLFNNNFKFHHKNSSSPTICIYTKILHNISGDVNTNTMNTPIPTLKEIDNILHSLEYRDNDFKFFFKIWPNINTMNLPQHELLNNVWGNQQIINQCLSLNYENKIYMKLRRDKIISNQNNKYTLTPILSNSNGFKLRELSQLLGISTQEDHNIFVYVFYTWLLNPSMPNTDYVYKENFEDIKYNENVKHYINYIENNLTFNYIMTPVIPNTQTFGYVMTMVRDNNTHTVEVLMENFCNIFVNIVEGIKTLKKSSINHNDLHENNIFVSELKHNGINTFIYDYDRSFCEKLNPMLNPMLNNDICSGTCLNSQCNRYDDWLDFFKILHYVFRGNNSQFNLLLLLIITGQSIPLSQSMVNLFKGFIQIITSNQFLYYPIAPHCSWYFDNDINGPNKETISIREEFKALLKNYETVIARIKIWTSPSRIAQFRLLNTDSNLLKNIDNNDGGYLLKTKPHNNNDGNKLKSKVDNKVFNILKTKPYNNNDGNILLKSKLHNNDGNILKRKLDNEDCNILKRKLDNEDCNILKNKLDNNNDGNLLLKNKLDNNVSVFELAMQYNEFRRQKY